MAEGAEGAVYARTPAVASDAERLAETIMAAEVGTPITAIETVRSSLQPNVLHVLVYDDQGRVGLGETFYGATSVESYIHETAAPVLGGLRSGSPQFVAASLSSYVGYSGSGAEVRGNSAIDIALWDLLAQRAGLPLRELLGGPFVTSIEVYNTCAGNQYVNAQSRQSSSNWGINRSSDAGRYEDLWRFLNEPGALARDLVAEGYRGMKVWPFDLVAEEAMGSHTADLRFGLGVLDEIRSAVGDDIAVYVELHSLWQPAGARRLLRELERFDLAWVEDPLRADHVDAMAALKAESGLTIAVGESVGAGINAYKPLLDARAIDVAIIDIGWSGGITAALKTASLAEQYGVTVAPHDCTGPVSLGVATHFVTAVRNGHVQEVARAFYHGWYRDMATGVPTIDQGMIVPADAAGHGVRLTEDFLERPGTIRRRTELR